MAPVTSTLPLLAFAERFEVGHLSHLQELSEFLNYFFLLYSPAGAPGVERKPLCPREFLRRISISAAFRWCRSTCISPGRQPKSSADVGTSPWSACACGQGAEVSLLYLKGLSKTGLKGRVTLRITHISSFLCRPSWPEAGSGLLTAPLQSQAAFLEEENFQCGFVDSSH